MFNPQNNDGTRQVAVSESELMCSFTVVCFYYCCFNLKECTAQDHGITFRHRCWGTLYSAKWENQKWWQHHRGCLCELIQLVEISNEEERQCLVPWLWQYILKVERSLQIPDPIPQLSQRTRKQWYKTEINTSIWLWAFKITTMMKTIHYQAYRHARYLNA